jgi:hypothetical protein
VLRQELVVGAAQQNDIVRTALTPEGEGVLVMKLESASRRAASALLVLVTASLPVTLADHTLHCCRDVA